MSKQTAAISSDEITLHLIASGIQSYYRNVACGEPDPNEFHYPPALQQGLNRLEAVRLHLPLDHPWRVNGLVLHVPALIRLSHQPLREWPLALEDKCLTAFDDRLLDDGIPTRICDEWAIANRDVIGEVEQHDVVIRAMEVAQQLENPQVYSEFRRFIARNPVTTVETLDQLRTHPLLRNLYGIILSAYMPAPLGFAVNGSWHLCPYCKSLKIRLIDNEIRCESERCRARPADLEDQVIDTQTQGVLWLKDGIRRYTFYPAQAELRVFRKLNALNGIKVELWPSYDLYDIRITFLKNQEVWALDVKDWANPYLLAKNVKPFQHDGWNSALFVIPAERTRRFSDYMRIFQRKARQRHILAEHVGAIKERHLLEKVRERIALHA